MRDKAPTVHFDDNNGGVACGTHHAKIMSVYLSDITCKTCRRIFKIWNGRQKPPSISEEYDMGLVGQPFMPR